MKSRILNFLYVFALFGYSLHHTAIGGDGFFYLATGDWVLSHGELPRRDPFSFNSTGPWLLHFPLCQIGFSVLVRWLGMSGLMFVCAAAATAAILALLLPYASTARIRFLTAIPLTAWIILDEELFNVRGQIMEGIARHVLHQDRDMGEGNALGSGPSDNPGLDPGAY
ncbi:MAG: hypothetical protein HZA01_09750 [Nitrospinae bacterium]|nr:hypothetical protein [Nitrospinota bacterium]